jgi:hypothetical protein
MQLSRMVVRIWHAVLPPSRAIRQDCRDGRLTRLAYRPRPAQLAAGVFAVFY